ncbi:MAG: D-alanyl-D-alanine carboxypeptidase [Halothece sp.]
MFYLFSLILAGFFAPAQTVSPAQPLNWEDLPLFALPHSPEEEIERHTGDYLESLSSSQGVLLVSDWWTFAENRPEVPHASASLTKIATTLAAVESYGVEHRFETLVKKRGEIREGKLEGDLIIEGGGDPFLVWEDAIALGNALNELGIEEVTGDLIVTGDFFMNYEDNISTAADFLQQAFTSQSWSSPIERQYEKMQEETSRPQLEILGETIVTESTEKTDILLRRHSLSLAEILREMNTYSNNAMSELIAKPLGGGEGVREMVLEVTALPPEEIQLINASGLGIENQMSPRAVVKMLRHLEERMAEKGKTLADLFPVTGEDRGTVRDRALPKGIPVKTGSLATVSTLAGVIPTETHGSVYFVIMNQDGSLNEFRQQQNELLQALAQEWQILPLETSSSQTLGYSERNILMNNKLKQ